MTDSQNPEIGRTITAAGIETNCHDVGTGAPVMLLHGSGPGVTAWANWRLVLPALSSDFRVIAPDIVGFGYTDRPDGTVYDMRHWTEHTLGVMDALDIEKCGVVGNSFGGALALALAVNHPDRVDRMVLMGASGLDFDLTPGLDAVWGYEPSVENMRALVELFAFNQAIATDDLARMRYEASIRPGYQESYASMFPAPRQRHIGAMAQDEAAIRAIDHETLIVHGREDRVIPVESSIRLGNLIPRSQLHIFGHCGHWTQIEQNARFCRLVADFFAEAA
jgi:2-hydroxymuconate-semialdehyde hydrolase